MSTTVEVGRPKSRAANRSGLEKWARRNVLQLGVTAVALAMWIFFLVMAPKTFTSYDFYNALMVTIPLFGIVAIPLTLVVITGEIDLSFGSITAWGMTAFDVAYQGIPTRNIPGTQNIWIAFVACLLAGLFAGWLNGWIVVRLGVPSLVATIGTHFFWAGLVILVTDAQGLGMGFMKDTPLYNLFLGPAPIINQIPMQFVWMIIIAIVFWFILNRTKFGAHVYLTGDNQDSARLMGVNTERVKILVFSIVGLVAAFAGFMNSAQLFFFWPTTGSANFLNTLAAVFLGGTSVFGGMGSIYGTFVASFIIYALNPGIVAIGWTNYLTQVIYGLIIVLSIALQAIIRKRLS